MKPTDAFPDIEDFHKARRDLVQAVSQITWPAASENSLAARNVTYHTEHLLTWIDAFYGITDADADA
jgi:hypothetical protein